MWVLHGISTIFINLFHHQHKTFHTMNIQDIKTYLLFRMLKDNDYTSYSKYDVIEELERRFYEK